MSPTATIFVGLPGLGKSNMVSKNAQIKKHWFVYSTDSILERIAKDMSKTYNDVFHEHIKNAQLEADVLLEKAIKDKLNIAFDQTNLGVGKRKKIINRMRNAGYAVNCVCLLPPEAGHLDDQKEWKLRLESRPGKTIPTHVLANMLESFVVPTQDEGFDRIEYYNMFGQPLNP